MAGARPAPRHTGRVSASNRHSQGQFTSRAPPSETQLGQPRDGQPPSHCSRGFSAWSIWRCSALLFVGRSNQQLDVHDDVVGGACGSSVAISHWRRKPLQGSHRRAAESSAIVDAKCRLQWPSHGSPAASGGGSVVRTDYRSYRPIQCLCLRNPGGTPEVALPERGVEFWSGRLDSNQRPPAPKAGTAGVLRTLPCRDAHRIACLWNGLLGQDDVRIDPAGPQRRNRRCDQRDG
jgi:hypothetical protein